VVLVDTSAWVEFLRVGGKAKVEERVRELLLSHEAAWCEMVRLELNNGIGGDRDQKLLREFEGDVIMLETDAAVWQRSVDLARKSREKGLTVPAADLLIAACAFRHGVEIESADNHFRMLAKFR
jgi:predicted nucleic acid-binding protein